MRVSREKIISWMIANYRARPILKKDFDTLFFGSIPSNVKDHYNSEKNYFDNLILLPDFTCIHAHVYGEHGKALMFGLSYCLFTALREQKLTELRAAPKGPKVFFSNFVRTQRELVAEPDLLKRLLIIQRADDANENVAARFTYGVDNNHCFSGYDVTKLKFLVPTEKNLEKYKPSTTKVFGYETEKTNKAEKETC